LAGRGSIGQLLLIPLFVSADCRAVPIDLVLIRMQLFCGDVVPRAVAKLTETERMRG